MRMNKSEIEKIIPHRDPMLLVSEVLELDPGKSIRASFYVDPSREIFKGHFPNDPVLPGVYSVESMAQVSDILLLAEERYAGTTPLFLGIDNVRFRKKILPGDTMLIEAELIKERPEKAIATCAARVYIEEELAAEGEVTLAMR